MSRLAGKSVCQFFIVRDQMRNVNIAVVLPDQRILSNLVSISPSAGCSRVARDHTNL